MHIEVQMKTNGGVQGKEKEIEGRKEGRSGTAEAKEATRKKN